MPSCKALGSYEILDDLRCSVLLGFPGPELKAIGDAIRSAAHILDSHPEQLPGQLLRKAANRRIKRTRGFYSESSLVEKNPLAFARKTFPGNQLPLPMR
jgi:hypothetical protein